MNAKAWLPLACCAIHVCIATGNAPAHREVYKKLLAKVRAIGKDAIEELFSSCESCAEFCSEDHIRTALQRMFPSMPVNASDYFCHDESTHYHFCQTDLTRYRTPTWINSIWHFWYTFLAQSVGHTWWSSCAFSSLIDPDVDGNGCLSRWELGLMFERVAQRFWYWTKTGYHKQIDTDSDGCASTAEITEYLVRRSPGCAFNLFHELPCLNSTEGCDCSLHVPYFKCKCPSGVSASALSEHLVFSAFEKIDSAVAFQRLARNGTGQLDQGRGEDTSNITLIASISGIIAIVALVASAITCWYQRNQRNALLQPHKLLRAKIDAWSTFDDNLIAKTSTLQPLFVHCLGLGGFQSDQLSLLKITHDEDVEAVSSLLHQMKSNKNLASLPLMAQVRFKHGVTDDSVECTKPDLIQSEGYVNVEVLMAWSSSTSIIVGLTTLSAPPLASCNPGQDFSAVVLSAQRECDTPDVQSERADAPSTTPSSRKNILNAPSQVTSGPSDAGSFNSMEATSHRGGLITKPVDDFKSETFKILASRLHFEEVPEEQLVSEVVPEPQARIYGKESERAGEMEQL